MNINEIKKNLYTDSAEAAIKYVTSINDEETLFIYANNYNWDNGFEIPKLITQNAACSLSIALLLFHLADGITYLETKTPNENLPEWSNFISDLYNDIKANKFKPGTISFEPELSKVQMFKLRKSLPEDDFIFIDEIEGNDCNILF